MKTGNRLLLLCVAGALFCGAAWAVEPEPTPTPVQLATANYVGEAYDSLDAKKQDKLSNGNNIKIENGTVNLDLSAVANGTDGVYVLTAIKDANNQITLKWENITRTTAN